MAFDPQCIFCRIVRGEAEASVVYRDDRVWAFLDLHPLTPGHLLVVPTQHAAGLDGLDDPTASAMMVAGKRLAQALRRPPLGVAGVNLVLSDGAAAGQEVFHCHLHVIPRRAGDGFGFRRPPTSRVARRDELDRMAAIIRGGLGQAGS